LIYPCHDDDKIQKKPCITGDREIYRSEIIIRGWVLMNGIEAYAQNRYEQKQGKKQAHFHKRIRARARGIEWRHDGFGMCLYFTERITPLPRYPP
jgi:hypothetical protein